ncbi:MAG: ATP-binding protein [Candidatus Omnitrophota bacterium]|nr:ATP-binding protein [Candidatus Omnitrophota bacterium]
MNEIRPKERDAVIQSLRAGVVPRVGQHLIQVGRVKEVEALLKDIDRIIDGGSTIRFVIGEYGSGKTFFLNLIRAIALEKRLITAHADLSPDKRFQSTGGQARSLYAELIRNVSTRSKPEGGAIQNIVERFIAEAMRESQSSGIKVESIILRRLEKIYEMVGGYDFAQVISAYWKGHDTCNEQLKSDAIRWLRGEFSTKTEAKLALGVRTIIDDMSIYDHLKLMAIFVRLAGYSGLLICFDELVNLYKLANSQSRNANYEQILRMVNDSLQGIAVGLGIIMGGTPEFLMDTRRGLYSYPALQSRLAENTFATAGRLDFTGPVLRLSNLSQEDFFVLITKIRHVYALGNPEAYLLPDEGLKAFMEYSFKKIGEVYFRTPRNTIKAFVNLLAVLEQNKDLKWQEMLGNIDIDQETNPDLEPLPVDVDTIQSGTNNEKQQQNGGDNLGTFKL